MRHYCPVRHYLCSQVYVDGVLFTTWTSSGTTTALESIDLWGTSGEMIEIVGVLEDSEWLSIVEVSCSTGEYGVQKSCLVKNCSSYKRVWRMRLSGAPNEPLRAP